MFSLNPFKKKAEPAAASRQLPKGASMSRMFAAANADRFGTNWGGTPLSADTIIERNQRVLVARSREQAANNDYAKAFLRMCRQNIVGPNGVTLQAQARKSDGTLDQAANEALEISFFTWGHRKNCDVTGKQSWKTIQKACINSAARDGEFILRMVFGADAGPWGFSLQVLDPVRLPVDYNEDRPRTGAFIRQGIEFNQYGRPLAYHFTVLNASEAEYSYGGRDYVRVPADEIIHGFESDMTGQKRGLPWMATGLFRLRQMTGVEDAAIINARVGASKMGFIEYAEGFGPEADDTEDLDIEVEAGTFRELPTGAKMSEWNPQYPSGEFAPFMKHALRGFAAGCGVLYNNLANDLEGVNFSSIRQGTLDERESWKDRQEWLIEQLIQPVFEAWLPRALLAGRIKIKNKPLNAAMIDKYSTVSWQGRRWTWIDPRADMDAAERSKNNLLQSPSKIIRENGGDPQEVFREIAADIQAMKDAGIDEKFIMLAMGQKLAPAPDENATKDTNG